MNTAIVMKHLRDRNSMLRMLCPSIAASLLLLIIGQVLAPGYLSLNNISSILMTTSLLGLASMAQNLVIMAGGNGIDLSIGATMSMTALLGPAMPTETPLSFAAALFAVLLMGAACGMINGMGTQFLRIPPLIMTLIMSNVIYGFTYFVTKGQPSVQISALLLSISKPLVQPIRVLPLLVIVILVVSELLLKRSRAGKSLLICGDNQNAAFIAGLKVRRVTFLTYTLSGAIAGLAGFMLVGYAGSALMRMANDYTMQSVAAVVIGGTKLSGGKGSFVGGCVGALVLVMLNNILQALNMPSGVRTLIQGLLLVAILLTNVKTEKLRQ